MAGFLYRLCSPDGSDLGDYRTGVPDMRAGDVLYAEGWPKWRVRAVVSTDGAAGRRVCGDPGSRVDELNPKCRAR